MTPPDLAVVDVETTGFAYTKHDRIVEIEIVRTDFDGGRLLIFESLINPERDVGPTHIHGVTAEMVREAPPFPALADSILEVLEGTCLV